MKRQEVRLGLSVKIRKKNFEHTTATETESA